MIVSNTSPIYHLSTIGHLDLLHRLYGVVHIPEAVLAEITDPGNPDNSASIVPHLDWIKTIPCSNLKLVELLQTEYKLDLGESEAIALALQLNAEVLIIDERLGRKIAASFNLNLVGVLGVITQAKTNGMIQSVRPLLDLLIDKAKFRLSKALYVRALNSVGEDP